jgi:hypothetical protein
MHYPQLNNILKFGSMSFLSFISVLSMFCSLISGEDRRGNKHPKSTEQADSNSQEQRRNQIRTSIIRGNNRRTTYSKKEAACNNVSTVRKTNLTLCYSS